MQKYKEILVSWNDWVCIEFYREIIIQRFLAHAKRRFAAKRVNIVIDSRGDATRDSIGPTAAPP